MGGPSTKMSSSTGQEKTIFLTDTAEDIKFKVNKYVVAPCPCSHERD
jgi:tryptophanyl-tRNA synthetase